MSAAAATTTAIATTQTATAYLYGHFNKWLCLQFPDYMCITPLWLFGLIFAPVNALVDVFQPKMMLAAVIAWMICFVFLVAGSTFTGTSWLSTVDGNIIKPDYKKCAWVSFVVYYAIAFIAIAIFTKHRCAIGNPVCNSA